MRAKGNIPWKEIERRWESWAGGLWSLTGEKRGVQRGVEVTREKERERMSLRSGNNVPYLICACIGLGSTALEEKQRFLEAKGMMGIES